MKTLVVLAGITLVFMFVWERVDVVRVGYQIERLKAQKVLVERERDQLHVKLSALSAPERVAKVATERLGLMPPQPGQVFMVHKGSDASTPADPSMGAVHIARNAIERRTGE